MLIGLALGVARFDPALGFAPTTLITHCVENELRKAYRRNLRLKQCIPADRRVRLCEVSPVAPAAPEDPGFDAGRLIATLPRRQAEIVRLRVLDGLTLRDIGTRLGISCERVRKIESEAFALLRARPAVAALVEA